MIYPDNFEKKIGFAEVREKLRACCMSTLGQNLVDDMKFTSNAQDINTRMTEIREMRRLLEEQQDFPLEYFFDMRQGLARLRLEGTHMETEELYDLKRSLETIQKIIAIIQGPMQDSDEEYSEPEGRKKNPALYDISDGVAVFPVIIQQISQIIDKFGNMRDNASPELAQIRRELAKTEGSISRTLYNILHTAQSEGLVDKDVTPTLRDGRLVIPVAPGLKRKISGIVHDESATGRTVYIEPTQVVEANNKIRELENEERREIVRILSEMSKRIRPHIPEMLDSYHFLSQIDFIQAKTTLAKQMKAYEPEVRDEPYMDLIRAKHPLLDAHLAGQMNPLDIMLTDDKRILIISGPNAGGKSVCLKTAGLLQYMLQSGMSIPVSERTTCGVFSDIMIDIGDEQSIENDLSTYSSHLLNMKNMMRQASNGTLILIDEFGTGTEPQIGGAIAESVLKQFWQKKAWAIITTHYQNLKHFADEHSGVANGAMLYDRHMMQPLFQLAIGRPGSSFAIEIARKTGIPEEVIKDASEIVGSDYIQSDKYLQDIVRDKRYWENKRQNVHEEEKRLAKTIATYQVEKERLEESRKEILKKAKEQAEEMLREGNRRIENAIREIREKQAEKEETKRIREELKNSIIPQKDERKAGILTDDEFQKKIAKIQSRKERHKQHLANKQKAAEILKEKIKERQNIAEKPIDKGDTVRIKGLTTTGTVVQLDGKQATVVFGEMKTKMPVSRLEIVQEKPIEKKLTGGLISLETYKPESRITRSTIDEHRKSFKQEIDVRGMRADEALLQVQNFLDDAILVGVSQIRILHGKGNGILRTLIRQYLATVPNVNNYRDEHVQFGGAGITVVEL